LFLSSAYPDSKDYDEDLHIRQAIYDSGIQLFVNLMQTTDLVNFIPYEPEIGQNAI
jgi:hypothetical protein